MTKFSLLFSSICSLFVLSWVLTRWYSPANCINSTLVGKVVINSSAEGLEQCTPVGRLLDSQPLSIVKQARLLNRLEELESVAPYLAYQDMPLVIDILTESVEQISLHGEIIRISPDLLRQRGVLERAILFLKLNNSNPLAASAIANFLWFEFKEKRPTLIGQPWMKFVKTLRGYCASKDILLLHNDYCRTHNELSDSFISADDSSPVSWGLVPIYEQVLHELYRKSSLLKKQTFLNNLIFLGELEDGFIENIQSGKNISDNDKSFSQMLRDWTMPLMVDEVRVEEVVSKFSLVPRHPVNYVYIGRSSRDIFPIDFNQVDEKAGAAHYVVQLGMGQYFFPSDVAIGMSRKQVFESFNVEQSIYVSCDMPEVESLLEFDGLAKRILFVKQCDENEIDWNAVAKIGLNDFLHSNANIEFVEFNISALKLAKKVRGPLRDSDNFSAWQKWLLWQKIVNDDGPQIQRPLSAIDGVGRFRVF